MYTYLLVEPKYTMVVCSNDRVNVLNKDNNLVCHNKYNLTSWKGIEKPLGSYLALK